MAIKIDNDYPEFRITDTLHQLVDRLNQLTNHIDSNTRLFDSAVNTMLNVVDSNGELIRADSDLAIRTDAGSLEVVSDSDMSLTSGTNITIRADEAITMDAGTKMFLNADSGEILLRSQGTQFGALKKVDGANEMEIYTGLDTVLTFDSNLKSAFAGEIEMPASGTGAPTQVTARKVNEALDEIVTEHDSDHTALEARVAAMEPEVTDLRNDLTNASARIDGNDSDISVLQAVNIENRLANIEAQIITINNRLDVLEIFT